MGAPKGRPKRKQDGERTLFANVGGDVIDRLEAGARELNMTRAAYIELLVREMPVDDSGVPTWLLIWRDEQLPLTTREESDQAAA